MNVKYRPPESTKGLTELSSLIISLLANCQGKNKYIAVPQSANFTRLSAASGWNSSMKTMYEWKVSMEVTSASQ